MCDARENHHKDVSKIGLEKSNRNLQGRGEISKYHKLAYLSAGSEIWTFHCKNI